MITNKVQKRDLSFLGKVTFSIRNTVAPYIVILYTTIIYYNTTMTQNRIAIDEIGFKNY